MGDEAAKKHCGAFVVMKYSGKRYLFAPEVSDVELFGQDGDGVLYVIGKENDKMVFKAPLSNVECWGWNTTFFKDAWWGKQ